MSSTAMIASPKRLRVGLMPLFIALFAFAGFTDRALTPVGVQEGYMVDAGGTRPSTVALAHAAGEFRAVAANILWLKIVDHYHHQYMAQGGDWSKNKDILPLINMITELDPHFTQAYDVGGLILCELKRYDDASSFLKQGIANNPNSWELIYDMSMMYAWYKHEPGPALPYAIEAKRVATDPFDKHRIGLLVRTLKRQIHDEKLAKAKQAHTPKRNTEQARIAKLGAVTHALNRLG